MAIYEPTIQGTGIFSGGVGKDSPYGKSTGLFKPQYHRFSGRFGGIGTAIKFAGRYFQKNPRFGARIGAVAGGAAVKYATSGKYGKTYRSVQSRQRGFRKYNKPDNRDCCCHSNNKYYRGKRRF